MQQIKTLKDIIDNNAQRIGKVIAVKYKYRSLIIEKTYLQLKDDIMELAESIDGMRIGIISENCYDWLLVYYSTIISGGVVVPIAPDISMNQVIEITKELKLDIILVGNNYIEKINKYSVENNIINIGKINCGELFDLKTVFDKVRERTVRYKKTTDVCAIYFTSGTTRRSKSVMLGNNQLVSNCIAIQEALQFEPDKIGLNVLPFHHSFASMCDLIYTLYIGATLCILEDLRYLNEEMDRYKPQQIFVVPLLAESLLKRIKYEEKTSLNDNVKLISYLKHIICGGTKIRQEIVKEYANYGVELIRGYGITECSPVVAVMNRDKRYDNETVGTPLNCNKIMIKDGEVCVKGNNVMLGYYSDENSTIDVMKDGWFRTGDYGFLNEEGDLYILGRKKNMIILDNGENIIPEEIEEIIELNTLVKECLIFEERNIDQKAHISILIVIQNEECRENMVNRETIYKILEEYNSKMSFGKNISYIYFRDELFERTSTKKVKRVEALNHMVRCRLDLLIKEAIQSVLYEKINVNSDMKFVEDLGMDSFEIVRLIGEIEKRISILLCVSDIYMLRSVQDIINYILKYHVQVDGNMVFWKKEKMDKVFI